MSTTIKQVESAIPPAESFVPRHVGPDDRDVAEMLKTLGFASLDGLMDATIPKKIRLR
jgi:glycine dehydrogenase